MKNCVYQNVRKHTEIKGSEKYITLNISLKFGILDNIRITSSDTEHYLGISGNRLITYLSLKTNVRSNNNNKSKVCHY